MIKGNDLPFFPVTSAKNVGGEVTVYTESAGITLRDYFAAKAMQSIIALNGRNISLQASAGHAYEAADAMLKARG